MVGARRPLAVGEGGDLSVGATDADFARAQEDLPGAEHRGFVLLDDRQLSPLGEDRQRLHPISTWGAGGRGTVREPPNL